MVDTFQDQSVDPADVARFSAIASAWWDPKGDFAPLHRFNPVRLAFIRETAADALPHDPTAARPFTGYRLLDVGCGGGLLAEPMSRLGFEVVGVDASERNVGVARAHALSHGLTIDYRLGTAEALVRDETPPFDIILNMEVIEHVADPRHFLVACTHLLKPGGVMIVATLNRTLKALALAKIGAEYVLRWLPRGMHDWRKFLKPAEIRAFLIEEPLAVQGPFGVSYDPLGDRWSQSSDDRVNYMMVVKKPPGALIRQAGQVP